MNNNENGKLDPKSIILIFLTIVLIVSTLLSYTRVNKHKDELKDLKVRYEKIEANNDSLINSNNLIDNKIRELTIKNDKIEKELDKTDDIINKLKDDNEKINNYVKSLNADGIAKSLTMYLNKK